MKNILVTGGAGYIGSHTCVCLLKKGFNVTVIDNLSNSKENNIYNIERLSNKKVNFCKGDLLDKIFLEKVFLENKIDTVMHFAGLKSVSESLKNPLMYYENNFIGSLNLVNAMTDHSISRLIFSSSATVYGESIENPCKETNQLTKATNPYGTSKAMVEEMLKDIAYKNIKVISLRYFNPVGAHPSGLIGENPVNIPNNLVPIISNVVKGKIDKLNIFGGDYDTRDGTCERDFIHVMDLAYGHLAALNYIQNMNINFDVFNLGTGSPISVLQMLKEYENCAKKEIPYEIVNRRPGDLPSVFADATKSRTLLGWSAKRSIKDMVADEYNFQLNN